MLDALNLDASLSKEEYKAALKDLQPRLAHASLRVKQEKIPVIILFEGFGAAGKGSYISELILNWDPRGYKVYSTREPDANQARRPWLWRFWDNLPEYGKIHVLDRSWYRDVTVDRVDRGLSDEIIGQRTRDILTFERQLTDDGCCIIKLFLSISAEEQKKRFAHLRSSENTAWRVTDTDLMHNRQYKRHYQAFDDILRRTHTPYAPWHPVATTDRRYGIPQVFEIVASRMEEAILKKQQQQAEAAQAAQASQTASEAAQASPGMGSDKSPIIITKNPQLVQSLPPVTPALLNGEFPLLPPLRLRDVDLNKTIPPDTYKLEMERCVGQLSALHSRIYRAKIPVVIVYEGWDAAGKGGNIKRLVRSFDARGYEVIPVAAPNQAELNHHYLWRFWRSLPRTGHIAIFDRSWYGRVMVERVENLCRPEDWRRAYREINELERFLVDWNTVVVKFWLHIDSDEQGQRFESRRDDPEKNWKLSDEDWRNREKWPLYEEAVGDMLRLTNTEYAPWRIIESNDKKYARIRVMKIMIEKLREALGE